ncbi:tetratricopeptide repeat protein [Shewanella sp. Scap07]|uniref:co-chaperone YbbN n=1 Tax=Shewanella sp. Scap07 TaxID=2589987 RepID=UPI0015B8B2D9|nr:tetratricopeptide repeat protein [Shewanella sp. Scap07]QLE85921.1 tetratricopeptide repeat protein [Shewanella sp. Scap07]
MQPVLDLTKENIQQVVDASMQQIIVLNFWSEQSPESVTLLNTLTAMAQQSGRFVLAKVNCDTEMEIANYFQIQSLPTTMVLSEGKPIDGFAGLQEAPQIEQLLEKHLPAQWQLDLQQAKQLLAEQQFDQALPLLKQAYSESTAAEVALPYVDALLSKGDLVLAQSLLDGIGLADQDSYFQSLKAKLSLALDAADTPEIRNLQQQLATDSSNMELVLKLATALHQANRNDEALESLFAVLQKDMSALDGNIKQLFLDILTAMGQGDSLANQYRRKLYTLLY